LCFFWLHIFPNFHVTGVVGAIGAIGAWWCVVVCGGVWWWIWEILGPVYDGASADFLADFKHPLSVLLICFGIFEYLM